MFLHIIQIFTGKRITMKKTLTILIAIYSLLIIGCKNSDYNPEFTQSEFKNIIGFLASDSLKGRYPGSPEDKVTANYIAAEFENAGLNLLFENGLQKFNIKTGVKPGINNYLEIGDTNFIFNDDFLPLSYSTNKEVDAKIAFAGYGFNVSGWNDYEDIDIKDKWALILRGEPNIENSSIPFAMYSSLRTKATTAKDLGAIGVLFVSGEKFNKSDNFIELGDAEGDIGIPVIQIKRTIANEILSGTNYTIRSLESEINNLKKTIAFNLDRNLKSNTELLIEEKETYNIAAELKCNNKNAKYIVIGAHYDHLGFGGIGSGSRDPNNHAIHYGADDNASGVSSVIEIAEKLMSQKDSLKTNFIFAAFGAEEMGLLGSKYFVNNLPIPDSLIEAMINLDMLGRMKTDKSLQVNGIGTSEEGETILNDINKKHKLRLGFSYEGYGPSDHSSFYVKDIPVFFFSTGAHMDYHTPGDSLGSINFNGLKLASEYIYDFVYYLSANDIKLTFKEAGPKDPSKSGRRNFKVTLGIMPDFSNVEKRGLRADIVIKGKPAYKAGMKDGDIITAMNGHSVADVYEYMERLTKLKAGQIITVEVIRDDKKEVLIVQL